MSLERDGDGVPQNLITQRTARPGHPVPKERHSGSSPRSQVHQVYRPVPKPPPRSHRGQTHRSPSYFSPYPASRSSQQLHAVVTSSFSVDDERDDYYASAGGHSSGRAIGRMYGVNRSFSSSQRQEERWPVGETSINEREMQDQAPEERIPPPGDGKRPVMIPPSPPEATVDSFSCDHTAGTMQTTTYAVSRPENLKRSFWHHSRPAEEYKTPSIHPAFVPPKRMKLAQGNKKKLQTLTPRETSPEDNHVDRARWYHRTHSWGAHEQDVVYRQVRKTQSFPSTWGTASPRSRTNRHELRDNANGDIGFAWGVSREEPPSFSPPISHGSTSGRVLYRQNEASQSNPLSRDQSWVMPPWCPPMSPSSKYQDGRRSWNGPAQASDDKSQSEIMEMPTRTTPRERSHDARKMLDFDAESPVRRQVTFDSAGGESDPMRHQMIQNISTPPHTKQLGATRHDELFRHASTSDTPGHVAIGIRSSSEGSNDTSEIQTSNLSLCLLAQPEDRISLSETLCVIRENIEVFTATPRDVEAPAPGRKHPVVVGQVGLRCIHCRHTTKSSDRVKRAVCYPSSIKRIYRTVIDMKLDHFQHCQFVPSSLKERLDELKAINTRSTGTTMQYFVKAAMKMGMVDGPSGVRFVNRTEELDGSPSQVINKVSPASSSDSHPKIESASSHNSATDDDDVAASEEEKSRSPDHNSVPSTPQAFQPVTSVLSSDSSFSSPHQEEGIQTEFRGKIILSLPEDKMALSPLRCFLRENVCAFSATDEDIAVRTPTTFSVVLGQVGIGCIHCHALPAKERSNRAVCFPFSISRIYQSVADIQRFHLGECRMVPPLVRQRFLSLQSASSKGSKGLATRQYWVTSARKIGLIDTPRGIRFGRDPSVPATPAVSLDILAQVASNVTTASRPLVLPEDRGCIAEFLYVAMEQLQPCRFTEADRNKRRLKDVGCIGVECKHCAGQVESRKFFWSSVNAVESNFVSVHTHIMSCDCVPDDLKAQLAELKQLRKEQTARLKTGSQKAFFARVWKRLHGEDQGSVEASSNQRAKPIEVVDKGIQEMKVASATSVASV